MTRETKHTVLFHNQSANSEDTKVSSEHKTVLSSTNDENLRILLLELCLLLPSIEPVVGGSVKSMFGAERTTSVSPFLVALDLP